MNHQSEAWKEWIESEEGLKLSDPTTLGCTLGQGEYLKNRLWRAFMAGYDAAEKEKGERP